MPSSPSPLHIGLASPFPICATFAPKVTRVFGSKQKMARMAGRLPHGGTGAAAEDEAQDHQARAALGSRRSLFGAACPRRGVQPPRRRRRRAPRPPCAGPEHQGLVSALPPALCEASAWETAQTGQGLGPLLQASWPRVLAHAERIALKPARSYAQCTQGGGLFSYTLADAFASLVVGPSVGKDLPDVLAGTSGGAWWTANQQRYAAARLVPRVMALLDALAIGGSRVAAVAGVSVLRNGIEAQIRTEGDCRSQLESDRRQCDEWRDAFIYTPLGGRYDRDDVAECNFNLLKFGRWVTSAYGARRQYRRPSKPGGACPVLSSSSVFTRLAGAGAETLYDDLILFYAAQGDTKDPQDNTCVGYVVPSCAASSRPIAVSSYLAPRFELLVPKCCLQSPSS